MKARSLITIPLVLCLAAGGAGASSIGVFFAPDGSDCDGSAGAFMPFLTYFGAVLGGDAAATGITGAEFRVDGYDPAWFNTVTQAPGSNLSLGNPIQGGANIAFPTCQTGSFVLLYTVQSLATSPPGTHTFTVNRHTMPSNPNFQCQLVTLCDVQFTLLCVRAGQAFLNSATPCSIGVESRSWSAVKRLFD